MWTIWFQIHDKSFRTVWSENLAQLHQTQKPAYAQRWSAQGLLFPALFYIAHQVRANFKWSLWSVASENISSLLRIDSVCKMFITAAPRCSCVLFIRHRLNVWFPVVVSTFYYSTAFKTGQQIISSLFPEFWSGIPFHVSSQASSQLSTAS